MEKPFTFLFVHGAYHDGSVWNPVSDRLEFMGHRAIAPTLDIEDVQGNFDKDTDVVLEAAEGHDNIFLVAHSRGVEILPRFLARVDLNRVIGAAVIASGGPYGFDLKPAYEGEPELERHTDEYISAINWHEDGLTEVDPEKAASVFYNELKDEGLLAMALKSLRRQRANVDVSPPPPLPPEIPIHPALGGREKLLNLVRAHRVYVQWLGKRALEIPNADHTPQLSQPGQTTALLRTFAEISARMRVSL